LFSLWDQGGCDQDIDPSSCNQDNVAQTIACGDGVTCSDFGGEGTGRKSYMTIQNEGFPVVDEEYYFVTQAKYLGGRKMQYTGYFYIKGEWKLLSRIQVSTNANEDWSLDGLYSFVEQWTEVDTDKERSALYGPSFMAQSDGQNFVPIDSARFSHGTLENHEHVNAWQEGPDKQYAVGIATGGYVERQANRGQTFYYDETNAEMNKPILLEDFSETRIPCLNDAVTTNDIQECLTKSADNELPTESPTVKPTLKACKDKTKKQKIEFLNHSVF
jgi:hypothetical protein